MISEGTPTADVLRDLKTEWCDSFSLIPVDDNTWSIASPFLMPDGDGLAIILRHTSSGWQLSDDGMTASRAFAELDVTAAREARLRAAADLWGIELAEWVVQINLAGAPEASDIAD